MFASYSPQLVSEFRWKVVARYYTYADLDVKRSFLVDEQSRVVEKVEVVI